MFAATYDAWGKQTVTNSTFKFHRGYTGHEHLPEFGLINMNGRMYDPVLGRFLSPDPFVQAPDFSQSFNRYSYCWNNPLVYTDPSGEYIWVAMAIGFITNYVSYGMTHDDWGGKALKSGLIGAGISAVGFGVGYAASAGATAIGMSASSAGLVGSTIGGAAAGGLSAGISGGNVGQGMLAGGLGGLAGGVINMGTAGEGFIKRGITSTLTGAVSGGLSTGFFGGDVKQGMMNGAMGGAVGFAMSEAYRYVQQRNAERAYMEQKLGLSKEQIRELKQYGLGRINVTNPISDADMIIWHELTAGHADLKGMAEWLRTRDYDSDAVIKAGKMHIRYGKNGTMVNRIDQRGTPLKHDAYQLNQGTINVHYDRFDVILNPVLHLLFDTIYQGLILNVH